METEKERRRRWKRKPGEETGEYKGEGKGKAKRKRKRGKSKLKEKTWKIIEHILEYIGESLFYLHRIRRVLPCSCLPPHFITCYSGWRLPKYFCMSDDEFLSR